MPVSRHGGGPGVPVQITDWLLLPGWGFSTEVLAPVRDALVGAMQARAAGRPVRVHLLSPVPELPEVVTGALTGQQIDLPVRAMPESIGRAWVDRLRHSARECFAQSATATAAAAAAAAAAGTGAAGGEAPASPDTASAIGICAWSLGATLALDWAARHPAEIGALVLVGGSPCFVATDDWPCAMPQAQFEAFARLAGSSPRAAQARLAALSAQGEAEAAACHRLLRAAVAAPESPGQSAGFARQLRDGLTLLRASDLRARVGAITAPVTLVHGVQDALVPIEAVRWLAAILPAARCIEVPSAGHAPFALRTSLLVDAIMAAVPPSIDRQAQ